MNRKLINYLPFIVRDYAEFQGITWAEQPEFENAWASVEKILANQFVRTADNLGLSRWEKILGIVPKGTDTLDGRRFRILARLNERLPYTLPRFRQMLESLCGTGNTSAEIATGTYRLRIWIVEEVLEYLPELRSLTARIVPVNLSCFYEVQMEPVQLFNFNIFELVNLKICGRVNNWGMEIARFNGRRLFDGSIRFDQQVHRDNLLGLEIRGLKWQTRETIRLVSQWPARVSNAEQLTLQNVRLKSGVEVRSSMGSGLSIQMQGTAWQTKEAVSVISMWPTRLQNQQQADASRLRMGHRASTGEQAVEKSTVKGAARQTYGTAASLIINRGMAFDGSYLFDGSKQFNANVAEVL